LTECCCLAGLIERVIVQLFFGYFEGEVRDSYFICCQLGYLFVLDHFVDFKVVGVELNSKEIFIGIVDLVDQFGQCLLSLISGLVDAVAVCLLLGIFAGRCLEFGEEWV